MEFTIYKIGKTAKEYKPLEEKFITFTLPHKIKIVSLTASKKHLAKEKQAQETASLIARIDPDLPTIILSEKGSSNTSEEFASIIADKTSNSGKLQFIIGGAYGFDLDALPKGLPLISLGKLTFPHDLAYIVLLEQVYRSLTIIKGKKYHY